MTPRRRILPCTLLLIVAAGCGVEAAGNSLSDSPPDDVSPTVSATAAPAPSSDEDTVAPASVDTAAPVAANVPDVALVDAAGRAVVIRDGVASAPVEGLIAPDRRTLVTRTVGGGTTTVRWIDLADSSETGALDIAGEFAVVAVDLRGRFVALTGAAADAKGATELVVASPEGISFRQTFAAELLPEGFSTAMAEDGTPALLFVVEYLGPPVDAAEAPRPYRVRVVDLTTGELILPFNLRDKSQLVDQEMLGYGRSHALSRRDGLLFTLYRGIDVDDFHNAFVHTLGFGNGVWCLDVPNEMALDHLPGAITLTDDDARLLVASANGLVTEFVIDAVLDPSREPLAARTVQGWTPTDAAGGTAVASAGDWLVVGQGTSVRWLDTTTLTEQSVAEATFAVEAVTVSDDATVTVAGDGFLAQLSPSGESVGSLPLPAGFGPVATVVLLDA